MAKLKVTQTRSVVRKPEDQRQTLRALGLRGIRQTATHNDTPQIRGMIRKVDHLIEVEEIDS